MKQIQQKREQMQAGRRRAGRLARCLAILILAGAAAGIVPGTVRPVQAGEIAYRTYLDLRLPKKRDEASATDSSKTAATNGNAEAKKDRKKAPNAASDFTLEQREKLGKERTDILRQWDTMTPEQMREALDRFQEHVDEERLKNLTGSERKEFQKQLEERKKLRERLSKMTEEQRRDYFQKRRAAMVKKQLKSLSKEGRKIFLEREKRRQKRAEEFRARWKEMTPEEKKEWAKNRPMPGGF